MQIYAPTSGRIIHLIPPKYLILLTVCTPFSKYSLYALFPSKNNSKSAFRHLLSQMLDSYITVFWTFLWGCPQSIIVCCCMEHVSTSFLVCEMGIYIETGPSAVVQSSCPIQKNANTSKIIKTIHQNQFLCLSSSPFT